MKTLHRLIRRRPSPATAIASLALFVALGGASYAVTTGSVDTRQILDDTIRTEDIRNNVIRTQDLRNNEVRGRDIRNSTISGIDVGLNRLGGGDIDESSLAIVPTATNADLLDGTDSSGFVRAGTPTTGPFRLASGWSVPVGEVAPAASVDPVGYVHLRGSLVRLGGTDAVAGVLPAAAAPAEAQRFPVFAREAASQSQVLAAVLVTPSGEVRPTANGGLGSLDLISLDGLSYKSAAPPPAPRGR